LRIPACRFHCSINMLIYNRIESEQDVKKILPSKQAAVFHIVCGRINTFKWARLFRKTRAVFFTF